MPGLPSGYPVVERSLGPPGSPLRGTGIWGPEKNAQKRPADCNDAVSENEPPHRSPPIRGLSYTFRKSPVAYDCVVVDAASVEPVSTSKFPLSGKLTAYFADSGCSRRFSRPIDGLIQW